MVWSPKFRRLFTWRPQVSRVSIGTFEFFQLQPTLMTDGIVWSETQCPYRIATPEKALLDTLYLATRKGRRFVSLPALHASPAFRPQRLSHMIHQLVTDVRIRNAMVNRMRAMGIATQ
jgi:hypothetical protein